MVAYEPMHHIALELTSKKMSDNSVNVRFSGVRFICGPYLAIKSALASLGLIMTKFGYKWILCPQNERHYHIIVYEDNF